MAQKPYLAGSISEVDFLSFICRNHPMKMDYPFQDEIADIRQALANPNIAKTNEGAATLCRVLTAYGSLDRAEIELCMLLSRLYMEAYTEYLFNNPLPT